MDKNPQFESWEEQRRRWCANEEVRIDLLWIHGVMRQAIYSRGAYPRSQGVELDQALAERDSAKQTEELMKMSERWAPVNWVQAFGAADGNSAPIREVFWSSHRAWGESFSVLGFIHPKRTSEERSALAHRFLHWLVSNHPDFPFTGKPGKKGDTAQTWATRKEVAEKSFQSMCRAWDAAYGPKGLDLDLANGFIRVGYDFSNSKIGEHWEALKALLEKTRLANQIDGAEPLSPGQGKDQGAEKKLRM